MKRNTLFVTLLSTVSLASASSAIAAESSTRYRTVAVTPQTAEMTVLRAGSAWVQVVTVQGERVTVVFQTRFATIRRGNERIPVSYLRAGDRIAVTGGAVGGRLHVSSAVWIPVRTAVLP